VNPDGFLDMGAFGLLFEILVLDPLEAVGSDLPVCLQHGLNLLRRTLERRRHPVDGDRNVPCGEQPV
jgi:hypothetical protein